MATTTPSARAMLPTYLLRPCASHYHQFSPSLSQLSRHSTAQAPHDLFARAQTQEGNGANKQQPKKSAALSSAFERAAAYKKSRGKATAPTEGKPSPYPSPTDFNLTGQADPDQANSPASPPQGTPSPPSSDMDINLQPPEAANSQAASPGSNSLKSKQESEMASALAAKAEAREEESSLEVEIITRDGVIRRKVTRPGDAFSTKTKVPVPKRSVSSSDFLGLDFSEKKATGKGSLPAGLAVGLEAPPPGSLPTVEIITRDGNAQQASKEGLYKPKVVTWGIFERPVNISETYGGGRTIKPGEQLETEEAKKAREARTKDLLRAYHKKIGLDVDPQIKADCTKALKQGNELFERGYIQGALEQYEKVMQQMPYQMQCRRMS